MISHAIYNCLVSDFFVSSSQKKMLEFPLEKRHFTPHKLKIKKEGRKIELNWMTKEVTDWLYKISRVKKAVEKNGQVS